MKNDFNLAKQLDEFSQQYDPYSYMDAVDDSEQNIVKIFMEIQNGNIKGIQDWLMEVIENLEDGTDEKDAETAKRLLSSLSLIK